jgi:hypothetical protein
MVRIQLARLLLLVRKRNKVAAEEITYWAPAASTEQESFSSIPKKEEEKETVILYRPPQTPQEAIEMGLVASKAVKPRTFIPHWERLGISHKPKYWHCWWGCEGVQSVLDKDNKPTHDYYCPYWAMLMIFPEWEEDFSYAFYDRPPMPEGGPPLLEEEYNDRKRAYSESIAARERESERNPFNMETEQREFKYGRARIRVSRSEKDIGKELARNNVRTTPFSKQYHESGKESADSGWTLDEPKPKQKRSSTNNKRTK